MFEIALVILLLAPGLSMAGLEFLIWQRKAGRRFGMSAWLERSGVKTPHARLAEDREMAVFRTPAGLLLARLIGGAGTLYDMNDEGHPWSAGRPGQEMEYFADPLGLARTRAEEFSASLGVPVTGCVLVAPDTEFGGQPPFGVFRADIVDDLANIDFLFLDPPPPPERLADAWKKLKLAPSEKIIRFEEVRGIFLGGFLTISGLAVAIWLLA